MYARFPKPDAFILLKGSGVGRGRLVGRIEPLLFIERSRPFNLLLLLPRSGKWLIVRNPARKPLSLDVSFELLVKDPVVPAQNEEWLLPSIRVNCAIKSY